MKLHGSFFPGHGGNRFISLVAVLIIGLLCVILTIWPWLLTFWPLFLSIWGQWLRVLIEQSLIAMTSKYYVRITSIFYLLVANMMYRDDVIMTSICTRGRRLILGVFLTHFLKYIIFINEDFYDWTNLRRVIYQCLLSKVDILIDICIAFKTFIYIKQTEHLYLQLLTHTSWI